MLVFARIFELVLDDATLGGGERTCVTVEPRRAWHPGVRWEGNELPKGAAFPVPKDWTMSSHETSIRRLFEGVWNGADPDVASELVHVDYVIHDRDLADELCGPELYRALASATLDIFPDATFAIEDVVEDGDEVALRWTMTGTHEGSIAGEEPTGKRVELPAIEIDRFEDGRLVETWTQSDQLGLFEQVGLLEGTVGDE